MALDQLVGNSQNFIPMNPNDPAYFRRLDGPGPNIGGNPNPLGASPEFGNLAGLGPLQPGALQPGGGYGPGGGLGSGGGIMHTGILGPQLPHLRRLPGPGFGHIMPLPDFGLRPQPIQQPDYSSQFDKFGETLGGYSSQFDKFGEQLGGLGEQMTGYQDALGSFNEQMGGMGKQFETINNRLDSVDKGLGSLGNQIASFENMQKAQPQEVMQPQRPAFNPFGFGGFGGFGGLGSLFGRRY